MSGVLHVIDQLGLAHQAAVAEVERLAAENDELRALLAAKEPVNEPDDGGWTHLANGRKVTPLDDGSGWVAADGAGWMTGVRPTAEDWLTDPEGYVP